jgi:hypothetical protein
MQADVVQHGAAAADDHQVADGDGDGSRGSGHDPPPWVATLPIMEPEG